MTNDERLERPAATMESITAMIQQNAQAIDRLAKRDKAIAERVAAFAIATRENRDAIRVLTDNVNKLVALNDRGALDLERLEKIAVRHDRRIESPENRP
jgi:methyl-accepting chemotaxis protein